MTTNPEGKRAGDEFLEKIRGVIEKNLSDSGFGVSELASAAGMSRSNLLRRVKSASGVSVSRFISRVRLEKGMEMMREGSYTVSEVAFSVGFGSTSYFVKCFHDYYGFPPGEASRRSQSGSGVSRSKKKTLRSLLVVIIPVIITATFIFGYLLPRRSNSRHPVKSIAVLPFKNDSADSTNIYFVNGLMESVLNNLQKIENLRVISRTSVEKYRNSGQLLPRIARELGVQYIVEGSGQRLGDEIMLSIQLIDATTDSHLWAHQYNSEATDIFSLQYEVASDIASQIEAVITPQEKDLIRKPPAANSIAYDYFMRGLDLFYVQSEEALYQAIEWFGRAIDADSTFARAYADIAIAYYYLDVNSNEKKYSQLINYYADKALLYDSELAQSMVAKALYYLSYGDHRLALPYLEKALRYNPNSSLVINTLSDFYANYLPDAGKYLEYALKGAKLDIASNDSLAASVTFLHLGNALIQLGFTDEAYIYINKALAYDKNNIFAEYVKAYIVYARDKNLAEAKEMLQATLAKDPTRLDVLQETAKLCYYMRDYELAYRYYKPFVDARNDYNLSIYRFENAKIGLVMNEMGLKAEADKLFDDYLQYATSDESIYRNLSLAVYHSYMGDRSKAIEFLQRFSEEDDFHYWTIIFLKIDPLVDNIRDLPEFERVMNILEKKFWKNHARIKAILEKEELI